MPRGKKDNISKKIIKKIFNSFGLEIKRKNNFQDRYFDSVTEMTEREVQILNEISEIALSSVANQWSIIQSLKHIKEKNIPGEIVECGVYKGGSLILICLISQMIELSRAIIGFDTFEDGFDKISKFDLSIKKKKIEDLNFEKNFFPSVDDVLDIIKQFNIKKNYFPKLVKGKTQETLLLSENIPNSISFLRLDTDIYEPTADQLDKLYPKLSSGGILHIDDYGHCPGVKKAVDEYFKGHNIWLHRVDYTCRLLVKE